MGEKEWVTNIASALRDSLTRDNEIVVETCADLPYRNEIYEYEAGSRKPRELSTDTSCYETDLLISEKSARGGWVPRVIVECKLGAVTTHDALTYSAKAATHKHVHPYLRYGILIGRFDRVPGRLIRHGAQFDFMVVWSDEKANKREWTTFIDLLGKEIEASRKLHGFLSGTTTRHPHKVIHRPLVLPE